MSLTKFIGCILNIKTKSSPHGHHSLTNVVGTVKDIRLRGDEEAKIVLEDVMANGVLIEGEEVVIGSSTILDLQVVGQKSANTDTDDPGDPGEEGEADDEDEEPLPPQPTSQFQVTRTATTTATFPTFDSFVKTIENMAISTNNNTVTPRENNKENQNQDRNNYHHNVHHLKGNGGGVGDMKGKRQKRIMKRNDKETFEDLENFEEEFDFEMNNKMFEKLPTTTVNPTKNLLQPPPSLTSTFTSQDTTVARDRSVNSVRVPKSNKSFLTDTGIKVPVIDLRTRSRVLNIANEEGLTHERTIEAMSHNIFELALPLLGDACRLSPERGEEQRPRVWVGAGPSWQGAIALAAARLLATVGVHIHACSPKQDLSLLSKEEHLLKLCGENVKLTRDLRSFVKTESDSTFDLVIMAIDSPYSKAAKPLVPNDLFPVATNLIVIDPPPTLIPSYAKSYKRVNVVCPLLPLDYGGSFNNDESSPTNVKYFVVNIGIPKLIWSKVGVAWRNYCVGGRGTAAVFLK